MTGTYEPASDSSPTADLTQEQVTMLTIWTDKLLEGGLNNPYFPGFTVEGKIESVGQAFNTSWSRVARFTPFLRGGDIRTEFKIRVNSVFEPGTVEAQIRINGAPAGVVHSHVIRVTRNLYGLTRCRFTGRCALPLCATLGERCRQPNE